MSKIRLLVCDLEASKRFIRSIKDSNTNHHSQPQQNDINYSMMQQNRLPALFLSEHSPQQQQQQQQQRQQQHQQQQQQQQHHQQLQQLQQLQQHQQQQQQQQGQQSSISSLIHHSGLQHHQQHNQQQHLQQLQQQRQQIQSQSPDDQEKPWSLKFVTNETPGGNFQNAPAPSSGIMTDSAARNRMRVAKACDRCKRKKTKCDGQSPCYACLKSQLDCIYTPTPMPNPNTSVAIEAETLTNAIEAHNNAREMADQKKAIMDIKKPVIMAKMRDRITVLENDLVRLSNVVRTREGLKRKRPDAKSNENMGQEDVKLYMKTFLSNDQSLNAKLRYTRRHAKMLPFRFAHELMEDLPEEVRKKVKIPRGQYYGWNMSGNHYLSPRTISPLPEGILKNKEWTERLVLTFLDRIDGLFAILHRGMFMKQVAKFWEDPGKKELRLFAGILCIVCAIGMRFLEVEDNEVFEEGLEEKLFDNGWQALMGFAFEWESVEIIQGFLLMTIYLRACHRQPSAWACLGKAIRMCSGMGLMHKIDLELCVSDYEVLKRRRVFWACFVMDRTFCMECGRHFSIREDEISLEFPTEYQDDGWQSPISSALVRFCLKLSNLVYDKELILNSDQLYDIQTRIENFPIDEEFKDVDLGIHTHFKLIYYNSLFFIHMHAVFGLIGTHWDARYVDRQLYINTIQCVVREVSNLHANNRLASPWWLTLNAIYHAGCLSLLLISNQIAVPLLRGELIKILVLIQTLVDDGRFIMARECLWSLKTLNQMVCMRLNETAKTLSAVGPDPAPASVNKVHFTSMGILDGEGNEILPVAPSTPQQPGTHNPAMNLEWFDNWDWDINNSMNYYLATPDAAGASAPAQSPGS